MAHFWLVPVQWSGTEAQLLSERLLLEQSERRERFVSGLQSIHPRLLLVFKAALLLSDEVSAACGVEELPFLLAQEGDIRLIAEEQYEYYASSYEEVSAWPLSHCAEAYLNRLLSPQAAFVLLEQAQLEEDSTPWLQAMEGWLRQGLQVILLRED
ncbi:hypothetical protein [Paenibacillus cremeus]|uniref:Uncharacterized protein n=1 Tax=Paenibacillus cremeus TaxID=2163881 RepID=A0A559KBX2_9BACL|nr:hypothetical protein [Paenibacillus cremeus]TVY09625.1 hypothetical protein FPZ49_12880 [Paenibacillus cremeus]